MSHFTILFLLQAKRLIEAVLDKMKVGSATQGSEQAYGDMFFSLFRTSISQYCVTCINNVVPLLIKRAESDPRRVCTILTSTVDLVCRDRELRKKLVDIKFEPRREKTNILDSDLVRHKPGCTATEDG